MLGVYNITYIEFVHLGIGGNFVGILTLVAVAISNTKDFSLPRGVVSKNTPLIVSLVLFDTKVEFNF